MKIVALLKKTTFASPKSAIFTDPFTSTNILAHLISLENEREKISLRTKRKKSIIKKNTKKIELSNLSFIFSHP